MACGVLDTRLSRSMTQHLSRAPFDHQRIHFPCYFRSVSVSLFPASGYH
jgi:hypothetical protein